MRKYGSKFYFLMHSLFLDACTLWAMGLLRLLFGLSRKHPAMPPDLSFLTSLTVS